MAAASHALMTTSSDSRNTLQGQMGSPRGRPGVCRSRTTVALFDAGTRGDAGRPCCNPGAASPKQSQGQVVFDVTGNAQGLAREELDARAVDPLGSSRRRRRDSCHLAQRRHLVFEAVSTLSSTRASPCRLTRSPSALIRSFPATIRKGVSTRGSADWRWPGFQFHARFGGGRRTKVQRAVGKARRKWSRRPLAGIRNGHRSYCFVGTTQLPCERVTMPTFEVHLDCGINTILFAVRFCDRPWIGSECEI